jgi:hypothetical protein
MCGASWFRFRFPGHLWGSRDKDSGNIFGYYAESLKTCLFLTRYEREGRGNMKRLVWDVFFLLQTHVLQVALLR